MKQLSWNLSESETNYYNSEKIAYMDESGNFGFDFEHKGTTEYYIICAIIIDMQKQNDAEKKLILLEKNILKIQR